eukprot:SAG11_NODE_2025_length_3908_cov_1.787346_4_plen_139_part_00
MLLPLQLRREFSLTYPSPPISGCTTVPLRPLETPEAARATLEAADKRLAAAEKAAKEEKEEQAATGGGGAVHTDVEATVAKEKALAEQAWRNMRKITDWQLGGGVAFKVWVWQLGDIFVVAVPGEPYAELQQQVRHRT